MGRQSEKLEREAEGVRSELAGSLAELRSRLTPGQIVDQFTDYAREGPAAEFLNNLAREIRVNPMPVLLIVIGIAWLVLATNRQSGMASRFDGNLRTAASRCGRLLRPRCWLLPVLANGPTLLLARQARPVARRPKTAAADLRQSRRTFRYRGGGTLYSGSTRASLRTASSPMRQR